MVKYLGVSVSSKDKNSSKIDRCCKFLLKQFNFMYHKSNYLKKDMLKFLFGAYHSSYYGAENWFEILNKETSIRKIGSAYHKAIKIISGLMKWESKHTSCDSLGLLMKKILIYFLIVGNFKSSSLGTLRHYFISQIFCRTVDYAFETVV